MDALTDVACRERLAEMPIPALIERQAVSSALLAASPAGVRPPPPSQL